VRNRKVGRLLLQIQTSSRECKENEKERGEQNEMLFFCLSFDVEVQRKKRTVPKERKER
jgi:hypothetical protein